MAIGDPWIRESYYAELAEIGFELITCVHPTARIDSSVQLKPGSIIAADVSISSNTECGKACLICAGTTIEYGVELADFVTLRPGCIISGNSCIKRGSQIHSGCIC